ncbi:MAG: M20 family metallopeptidase [Turicibacter sp.]
MSHAIHERPELGNQEYYACEQLTTLLKEEGFEVKIGIAGHETGFVAYKKGVKKGPVIGFLVEYDALKGLGHACGHNLIALMSMSSGVALSKVIDELGGEVRLFGCPAEEGGENGNAKESYVRHHVFEGVDVCMMIHPFDETAVTGESLAIKKVSFEFFGRPSHAASAPELGINALDAMILFFNGINALRQQVTPDVKIHGIITQGGDAPNIIPHYTKASFYIRANTSSHCDEISEKVINIGEGAALATGCTFKCDHHLNRVKELLRCPSFDELYVEEAKALGLEVKTEQVKSIGSTDAGNVSLIIPTIHPTIKICESGVAIHTQQFKEAADSEEGYEAMIKGGKILARIGLRLICDENQLKVITEEFNKLKEKHDLE